jgi:hypothetical protein
MAAGCAMAGSSINAKLIYIGSEFDKSLRKPKPGSENLPLIDDSIKFFRDFERVKGINLFNQHDYVYASKVFSDFK